VCVSFFLYSRLYFCRLDLAFDDDDIAIFFSSIYNLLAGNDLVFFSFYVSIDCRSFVYRVCC